MRATLLRDEFATFKAGCCGNFFSNGTNATTDKQYTLTTHKYTYFKHTTQINKCTHPHAHTHTCSALSRILSLLSLAYICFVPFRNACACFTLPPLTTFSLFLSPLPFTTVSQTTTQIAAFYGLHFNIQAS